MTIPFNKTLACKIGLSERYLTEYSLKYIVKKTAVGKIRKVRKTINLIGKDDSKLSVAAHIHKIICTHHPERECVHITILEWTLPLEEKRGFIRELFEHYDPIWQVRVSQAADARGNPKRYHLNVTDGRTELYFTYPGIDFLFD